MDRLGRAVNVQFDRASQELVGVQQAQNQRGVGDCGLCSAPTVASGTGVCAGAGGADTQHAALIHARDAAAAGSEGVYVHGGNGNLPARLELLTGDVGAAMFNEGDVGACAAHVEGDHTLFSQLTGNMRSSCRASRGPGEDRSDGLLGAVLHGGDTAVGLNHEKGRGTARL